MNASPSTAPDAMPEILSGTHLQILSVLVAELRTAPPLPGETLNILDIGCGDGLLIDYLGRALPILFPGVTFDIFGFDVSDHGVQPEGYFQDTIAHLSQAMPGIDWSARLDLISQNDPWPYAPGFFTATVSNQVLEHVRDHDMFFAETARVTRDGGVGVHVFPSKHTLIEQHTLVPLAHRFGQDHKVRGMIRWWSRLNRGRYPAHKAEHPSVTPDSYADRHADYLIRYTNFKYKDFFLATAKDHQLHATFKYTGQYVLEKLRRMRGKKPDYSAPARVGPVGALVSWLTPYLTNVTLVVRKSRAYDSPPG